MTKTAWATGCSILPDYDYNPACATSCTPYLITTRLRRNDDSDRSALVCQANPIADPWKMHDYGTTEFMFSGQCNRVAVDCPYDPGYGLFTAVGEGADGDLHAGF